MARIANLLSALKLREICQLLGQGSRQMTSKGGIDRRLATIMVADVVGFSSMMERDEEGAYARIRALQQSVINPELHVHHGRLVKTTGDGFLAEFGSPVGAVR